MINVDTDMNENQKDFSKVICLTYLTGLIATPELSPWKKSFLLSEDVLNISGLSSCPG